LIPDFGESIAQAAQEGFKAVWRNWRPTLPHEKEATNTIEAGVLTGLTGLRIAWDDGLNFTTLTPKEAEVASCYALHEINGFPDWIEDLAAAYLEMVRKTISDQIEVELRTDADQPVVGDVLSAVRYGPESVRQLCLPVIVDQLEKGTPRSSEVLRKAVDAILPIDEIAKQRLAKIAATRLRGDLHEDRKSTLTWLYVWLHADAVEACDFIEQECNTEVFGEVPLFLSLAAMFGEDLRWRHKADRNAVGWPVGILERLMRLSLKYVDPAQDKPLPVGMYHPDARDHAEEFRGWIAKWLAQSPGIEAHQALRRLAEDPDTPDGWQAHLRRQVEEHGAQATELPPWSEVKVAEFGATHESEPETGSALFRIVIDRLRSIKDDIERGDFSERALFRSSLPETTMQKWLAGRLERESRGRYSIVRETEVDLNKKPDIRVHHPRAGYVSIEIKPVDEGRYSFTELENALKDQLIGQYMRASGSRHGVLIIGMLKRRNWDAGDGSGRIGFRELVMKLNSRAQELVLACQAIYGLSVIGIDFTEPTTRASPPS
jgi:hypothetical protein